MNKSRRSPALFGKKYDFIIVGSGAGGATLARELSLRGQEVLVVEQGRLETKVGTYGDALRYYDCNRLTQVPKRSREGVILWRALTSGGSTKVSCGNGVPGLTAELAEHGIDLKSELAEVHEELHVAPIDEALLSEGSRQLRWAARELGYAMERMPKFIDPERCIRCGNCVLGCRTGARWTAESYLAEAVEHGAEVRYDTRVEEVFVHQGQAEGLRAVGPEGIIDLEAHTVILAAGGLGTPVILQQSGIEAGRGLFIDLMVNTYGVTENVNQIREPQMALVSTEFHENGGFLLSPYVSHPRRVRLLEMGPRGFAMPTHRILGIMTKISDEPSGRVYPDGTVSKGVTAQDQSRLDSGGSIAREILVKAGVEERSLLQTRPAGAHPGGTAAIGRVVDEDLQTEVDHLFVCDASVLPAPPGAPPIVTIVALAKRLGRFLA